MGREVIKSECNFVTVLENEPGTLAHHKSPCSWTDQYRAKLILSQSGESVHIFSMGRPAAE